MKHPIKRQWARVRFNPEAKLRHQAAVQRSKPVMLIRKGLFSPEEIQMLYPEYR
jgi:hypothetical protein